MQVFTRFSLLSTLPVLILSHTEPLTYIPCPLLGSYLPPPRIDSSSPVLQSSLQAFTASIDKYVQATDGRFGPITPNTTSFSIALFAGSSYIPDSRDPQPFFWEYHHTAAALSASGHADAESLFALGDLTQVFTALTLLVEEGDEALARSVVDYLPELLELSGNVSDATMQVDWRQVTLGSLAAHLAGIARSSDICQINHDCPQVAFLETVASQSPVELPDTTPIYSHAAFQIIATALEAKRKKPFATLVTERILSLLQMDDTTFLEPGTHVFGSGLTKNNLVGEPASQGLASTLKDLSKFGRSILTSEVLPPAQIRRWLKPVADTSNLRNAAGRPWEIYHFTQTDTGIDAVVDIYTKTGSLGRYSSYFGLVPSSDVGFAILAVNAGGEAPDLNAYADLVLGVLLSINELAAEQANATLAKTYSAASDVESTIQLELTGSDPGIAVTALMVNSTDWLSNIAIRAGINAPKSLDLRIYPTTLVQATGDGSKVQVFQGVIQDKSAPADAGTPTCISWMSTGELKRDGVPLDRFVVDFDKNGIAVRVTWPSLDIVFEATD